MWRPIARPINSPVSTNVGGGLVVSGLPIANRFVSNSATNGYALGSNANNGLTKQTPWLTVDFAIANAPTGSVIEANSGTYQSATFYNPTAKSLTIQGRIPNAVILQAANGQTRIVNVNPGGVSSTVTLTNLRLDGRGNTTRGVTMSTGSATILAGMVLNNCSITGVTQGHFDSGQIDLALIRINGLTCDGTISQRSVFAQLKDGSLNISGVTLSNVTTTGNSQSGVAITRVAGGVSTATARISGVTGTFTGPAGQRTDGVFIQNIDAGVIEANALTIQGGVGSLGALYRVDCNNATMTANGGFIRGNTGHNGHNGGYCAIYGQDGTSVGDNRQNNGTISGNTLTANSAASSPIHGLMIGFGSGGDVFNNTITGAALATIAKQHTGGEFHDNTIRQFTVEGIRSKGANGTAWRRNNLLIESGFAGDGINVNSNDAPVSPSTGIILDANVLTINAAPSNIVEVTSGSSAAFTENTYNVNVTLGAGAWNYQGTHYNTLAEWKAAVEPTAHP